MRDWELQRDIITIWKNRPRYTLLTREDFTVAAETPAPQLMLIRDFVNAVKECKAESDQVSLDLVQSLTSGLGGSFGVLKGILTDDGVSTILGAGGITYSAEEVHQFVLHFNAAKNAQKNAEKLFGEVFE